MLGIIKSTLMKTRQEMGIAHPKEEFADEHTAIFTLNLVMVFLNHCILFHSYNR